MNSLLEKAVSAVRAPGHTGRQPQEIQQQRGSELWQKGVSGCRSLHQSAFSREIMWNPNGGCSLNSLCGQGKCGQKNWDSFLRDVSWCLSNAAHPDSKSGSGECSYWTQNMKSANKVQTHSASFPFWSLFIFNVSTHLKLHCTFLLTWSCSYRCTRASHLCCFCPWKWMETMPPWITHVKCSNHWSKGAVR